MGLLSCRYKFGQKEFLMGLIGESCCHKALALVSMKDKSFDAKLRIVKKLNSLYHRWSYVIPFASWGIMYYGGTLNDGRLLSLY